MNNIFHNKNFKRVRWEQLSGDSIILLGQGGKHGDNFLGSKRPAE